MSSKKQFKLPTRRRCKSCGEKFTENVFSYRDTCNKCLNDKSLQIIEDEPISLNLSDSEVRDIVSELVYTDNRRRYLHEEEESY